MTKKLINQKTVLLFETWPDGIHAEVYLYCHKTGNILRDVRKIRHFDEGVSL